MGCMYDMAITTIQIATIYTTLPHSEIILEQRRIRKCKRLMASTVNDLHVQFICFFFFFFFFFVFFFCFFLLLLLLFVVVVFFFVALFFFFFVFFSIQFKFNVRFRFSL